MKKRWKKALVLGLSILMAFRLPLSFPGIGPGLSYGAERPASIIATSLNVRSAPGTTNAIVGSLAYGTAVTVIGEASAADGSLWYQIRFTGRNGASTTGYVLGSYVKFSSAYSNDMDFEAYLDSQGFPQSYRPGLRQLHARYPQWIFTAFDTGLDWEEVIQNESLVGRNLVSSSSPTSWKSMAPGAYDWTTSTWPGFDGSGWVAANESIIRYYMDPRNFLNETYIFQFLLQNYDSSVHTREGLASMVQGTFLEGNGTIGGAYTGTFTTNAANTNNTNSTVPGSQPGTAGTTAGQTGTTNNAAGPGGQVGTTDSTAASGSQNQQNSSTSVGIGPGYTTGENAGNNSNANGIEAGSGAFSDVWKGFAPGMNISRGKVSPSLSVSRHSIEPVAATVVRAGPGENGMVSASAGENTGSGVIAPSPNATSAATEPSAGTSADTAALGTTAPYVDILLQAGAQSGVSPYVLAAMILQEQGRDGKSESISGRTGYYNFFNFEAYASNGMTAVQRGLWYASQSGSYMRPWSSADKAIIGGAIQYGQNYMEAGQNTFYLKKFNVQGSNLYKHQYMTNVEGAASEGAKMGAAYSETMRQTTMRFSIPVYRNMPEQASQRPVGDGSPNNKLLNLSVNGYPLTPAFQQDIQVYDVVVGSADTSVVIQAASVDSTAQITGTGMVMLYNAVTEVKIQVTAQNGLVREYTVRITKDNAANSGQGETPATSPGNQSLPSGTAAPETNVNTGPGGSNVTIVY